MNDKPILNQRDLYSKVDQIATDFLSDTPSPRKYCPTGHEQVTVTVVAMEPIPPNANPFHHDDFSMGTDLPRGWVIMHPGFDNKNEPMAMQWMYLVNTRTGQRIRLDLEHTPSEEQLAAWKDGLDTQNEQPDT